MDAVNFPINSREILFLTLCLSIIGYVLVSLLTFKKRYNLDKLLHRGEYADAETATCKQETWTWRNLYNKLIGITQEYTKGDRILAWSVFLWSVVYRFGIIFLLVVISNSFSRWSSAEWGRYFCWTQVYIVGLVAIVSTIWFIWGGTRDLRRLFRDLAQRVDNPDDNGQVSDEFKKE